MIRGRGRESEVERERGREGERERQTERDGGRDLGNESHEVDVAFDQIRHAGPLNLCRPTCKSASVCLCTLIYLNIYIYNDNIY